MQAYLVPCWWVGWWLWRAGCISQDTFLLYIKENTLRPALIYHQTKLGNFLNFLPHNNANGNNFAKLFPAKSPEKINFQNITH